MRDFLRYRLSFWQRLDKTEKYQIANYIIKIIETYLTNRILKIRTCDYTSNPHDTWCGLPLGGVLSPLLFSLYINDIPIKDSDNENSLLFADDLIEMYTITSTNDEVSKINNQHLKKLEMGPNFASPQNNRWIWTFQRAETLKQASNHPGKLSGCFF